MRRRGFGRIKWRNHGYSSLRSGQQWRGHVPRFILDLERSISGCERHMSLQSRQIPTYTFPVLGLSRRHAPSQRVRKRDPGTLSVLGQRLRCRLASLQRWDSVLMWNYSVGCLICHFVDIADLDRSFTCIPSYVDTGNNLLQKNCVAVWHTGMCQATILHTKNCYTNILLCSICPKLRSKLHRYTRQIIPCDMIETASMDREN